MKFKQNNTKPQTVDVKARVESPKRPKSLKRYAYAGVTITGFLAIFAIVMGVDAFFDRYDLNFQSPVVIRTPIMIEAREGQAIVSPIPSVEASESAKPTATPTPEPETQDEVSQSAPSEWTGTASWYSRDGCVGCSPTLTMANGEPLDDNAYTVAFNKAPLGTNVLITNPKNGNQVVAEVTDTGGFERLGRIIDLTPAVRDALGCNDLCKVTVNVK